MNEHRSRRPTAAPALIAVAGATAMLAVSSWPVAAQAPQTRQAAAQRPPAAKAEKHGPPAKSEQVIAVLVNDDPITGYEVDQRAAFLGLSSGGIGGPEFKAKAEARWAQIVKDPRTNERLQQLLRQKNVRSREEALAVQKQFATQLQRDMVEQLKREARAGMLPRLRKEAQEELIEERLKLQEAKRLGFEVSDDEVQRIMKNVAERNKMTPEQFTQHLKGLGVDVATMQEKFRAQQAWREVVRRRFAAQISITHRDVDRMVSAHASEAGEDTVELQVQKLTLPLQGRKDQSSIARRYAEADGLRNRFGGCKSMAGLAREIADARLEDAKYIKPSSVPEPTQSMLLNARDGDMLPPVTGAHGIEVYAVCGRRPIKADEKAREKAQEELAQKEFEIVAKRHLRDLRQDAHIEYR
jgi:peptidyl-prolyl cis-trans isomerase SurA